MNDAVISIKVDGWGIELDGRTAPLCRIMSSRFIDTVGYDYDAYSGETIPVLPLKKQSIASFLFWSDARVHATIGDLRFFMVNLDNRIGIFIYSKTTKFTVKTKQGDEETILDKNNVWHCFLSINDGEAIEIKEAQ